MKPLATSSGSGKRAGRDLRADFPIFREGGRPDGSDNGLVYLDNGASAQKPQAVIDAIRDFYATGYANIHRGVYRLSENATAAYENGRRTVARFLNAGHAEEIVFVRGTTEGMNLLAQTFGRRRLGAGDAVLVTNLEHHSNIVPWQLLCEQTGAELKVLPIDDQGALILDGLDDLLDAGVKLVSVAHVSNALGTILPVREIIAAARARGIPVILDGAQSAPHLAVDVQELDCDFYVFSGHKIYGPTGIGAVYGKRGLLEAMPPWHGGGDMIEQVSFAGTTYAPVPQRFEAGTPNIAGVVGLAAALDYVSAIGWDEIERHGAELVEYGQRVLGEIEGLTVVGPAGPKVPVFSFVIDGIHPHDAGTILSASNIAIRAGHHCAQPLMDRLGLPATTRASLGLYNTTADLDALVAAIANLKEFFGQ